ncbi:MAG: elongation factor P hydroxylase [Gammaproteobacteria bacterium]|nr:elongation factor P hydroxylase [Gammaproteobacteria bacterium]
MSDDKEIASTFNCLFAETHSTVIRGGVSEPLYMPPQHNARGVIRYTRNYASSALHEIAHWCIAGSKRRRLIDYGYWYLSPPRSRSGQQSFFAVEARVQALEWLFAEAAGVSFHLSADDVHDCDDRGEVGDIAAFARQVECRVALWRAQGLPRRARRMFLALAG